MKSVTQGNKLEEFKIQINIKLEEFKIQINIKITLFICHGFECKWFWALS